MSTTPARHRRALLHSGAVLAVLLALLAGAVVLADEPADEPAPVAEERPQPPTPQPTPEPEPTPEPTPEPPPPVAGELELVDVVDLSTADTGLFQASQAENQPVAVDEAAVEAFAADVGGWLDEVLSQLNREGDLAGAADGLTGPEDPLWLGDPDEPIVEARYALTVGARGGPEWAEVAVEVTRADDSERAAVLVVAPGDPPALLAAGPGDADADDAGEADDV